MIISCTYARMFVPENPSGTAPAATTAMEDTEKDGKATVETDAGQKPADPGKHIEPQPEKSAAELAKHAEWEAKRERDRKKRAEWEAAEAARKEKRLADEEMSRAKKRAKEEANAERLRAGTFIHIRSSYCASAETFGRQMNSNSRHAVVAHNRACET